MVLSSEPKTTTCIFPPSTVELAVCLSVIPWWRRMEQMQQSKFCVILCQDSVCTSLGAHSHRVPWKQHWRKRFQLKFPQSLGALVYAGTAGLGHMLFTTQSCVSLGTQQFFSLCSPEQGWRLSPAFKDGHCWTGLLVLYEAIIVSAQGDPSSLGHIAFVISSICEGLVPKKKKKKLKRDTRTND